MKAKKKFKKNEELWIKIKDSMRSITKNLSTYDGKYMKNRFNINDELPLRKTPLKKFLPCK